MWYHSLLFPAAVAAIAFSSPPETTQSTATSTASVSETTPILVQDGTNGALVRRATTEEADVSVCGYFGGDKDSRLACYYGNECVFHASNTNFPGMVGCCPTSSTTTPCTIFSTCYNSAEVAKFTTKKTDPMALLCTFDDDEYYYCHTRTWPGMGVRDYKCTDAEGASETPRPETMYMTGSLLDVEDEKDQVTETIAVSWIEDAVLLGIPGVSATTASAGATTTGNRESSTSGGSSQSQTESGSGSTPTETGSTGSGNGDIEGGGNAGGGGAANNSASVPGGTIGGAVAGSVVGVLVIVIVIVFIVKRKKKTRYAAAGQDKMGEEAPVNAASEPSIHDEGPPELHGIDARERYELMPEREFIELPTREVRHELE